MRVFYREAECALVIAPVHYYHIWVGDAHHGSNWRIPAEEHFTVLKAAGYAGEVRVGLAGDVRERVNACQLLQQWWPVQIAARADEGFEQVTLQAMHDWAKEAGPDTPVYYAHTKGAFQDYPANHRWRRSMDSALINSWHDWVAELDSGAYDAIGLHWLTHQDYPDWISPARPMFGGNFWWARAGYLASLAPVEHGSRWHAEGWVGTGFPRVHDLQPGWPSYVSEDE